MAVAVRFALRSHDDPELGSLAMSTVALGGHRRDRTSPPGPTSSSAISGRSWSPARSRRALADPVRARGARGRRGTNLRADGNRAARRGGDRADLSGRAREAALLVGAGADRRRRVRAGERACAAGGLPAAGRPFAVAATVSSRPRQRPALDRRAHDAHALVAAPVSLLAGTTTVALYLLVTRRGAWSRGYGRRCAAFLPAGLLFGLSYTALFQAYYRGRVSVVAPLVATESLWGVAFAALLLRRTELVGRRLVARRDPDRGRRRPHRRVAIIQRMGWLSELVEERGAEALDLHAQTINPQFVRCCGRSASTAAGPARGRVPLGRRRQPLSRLARRLRHVQRRPQQPARPRGARRGAGARAAGSVAARRRRRCPRCWPRSSCAARRPRSSASSSRAPARSRSRRRSSSAARRRAARACSPPSTASTGSRSARSRPTRARSSPTRFGPLLPGFERVPWNDLEALEQRARPRGRRALPRRAGPGQGREPPVGRLPRGRAGALPPLRDALLRRRGADRLRPHRAACSRSSTGASSPT